MSDVSRRNLLQTIALAMPLGGLTLEAAQHVHNMAAAEKSLADSPSPTRLAAAGTPGYLTDASYRELARASSRARRHLEFQRLYRQLGLTREQVQQFEMIMARQDEARLDAEVARDNGREEKPIYERSGAEWKENMQHLLGESGFNQLQEYLRGMPVRAFVDHFAVQSAALESPITPAQVDQLASLALANDFMYARGKGTDPGTVNWNAVWDSAAGILTTEQLNLLQRTVEVWSLEKQMALRLKSQAGTRP